MNIPTYLAIILQQRSIKLMLYILLFIKAFTLSLTPTNLPNRTKLGSFLLNNYTRLHITINNSYAFVATYSKVLLP